MKKYLAAVASKLEYYLFVSLAIIYYKLFTKMLQSNMKEYTDVYMFASFALLISVCMRAWCIQFKLLPSRYFQKVSKSFHEACHGNTRKLTAGTKIQFALHRWSVNSAIKIVVFKKHSKLVIWLQVQILSIHAKSIQRLHESRVTLVNKGCLTISLRFKNINVSA